MIAYLLLSSLLIPANAWAAITPHLHSDLSMRVLHGLSTMVLLPLLLALWNDRRNLRLLPALLLAVFTIAGFLLKRHRIDAVPCLLVFLLSDTLIEISSRISVLYFG